VDNAHDLSGRAVGAEFVAVEVAKVRHLKLRGTFARSALLGTADRQSPFVKGIYFRPRTGRAATALSGKSHRHPASSLLQLPGRKEMTP
jgi:hypothetical protein